MPKLNVYFKLHKSCAKYYAPLNGGENRYNLAVLINQLTINNTPDILLPRRDWDHSGRLYGDPRKYLEVLSYKVTVGIYEGLEETIDWTNITQSVIDKC